MIFLMMFLTDILKSLTFEIKWNAPIYDVPSDRELYGVSARKKNNTEVFEALKQFESEMIVNFQLSFDNVNVI